MTMLILHTKIAIAKSPRMPFVRLKLFMLKKILSPCVSENVRYRKVPK